MISIQKKVEEVKKAIRLLAFQGYTILDLEDNMINKWKKFTKFTKERTR